MALRPKLDRMKRGGSRREAPTIYGAIPTYIDPLAHGRSRRRLLDIETLLFVARTLPWTSAIAAKSFVEMNAAVECNRIAAR
jgi:hypothetical protein